MPTYLTVQPSPSVEHADNRISVATHRKASEAALPKLYGKDERSDLSTVCPFPFNLFKRSSFAQTSLLSGFFPRSDFIQKSDDKQILGTNRSYEEEPEAALTALVTSISWTFSNDIRSKNASFPFPSSFFTDVPVMRSLSSGLKQQSVLYRDTQTATGQNPKQICPLSENSTKRKPLASQSSW